MPGSSPGWCGLGFTGVVLGSWLDLVILNVSSTFDDSMTLGKHATMSLFYS